MMCEYSRVRRVTWPANASGRGCWQLRWFQAPPCTLRTYLPVSSPVGSARIRRRTYRWWWPTARIFLRPCLGQGAGSAGCSRTAVAASSCGQRLAVGYSRDLWLAVQIVSTVSTWSPSAGTLRTLPTSRKCGLRCGMVGACKPRVFERGL